MTNVNLQYDIPKTGSKSVATQIARFSSLILDQGELSLMQMRVKPGTDVTVDTNPADIKAPLRRTLTLEPTVGFVTSFGIYEDPAVWNVKTIFAGRIGQALSTPVEVGP